MPWSKGKQNSEGKNEAYLMSKLARKSKRRKAHKYGGFGVSAEEHFDVVKYDYGRNGFDFNE